jgi:hypothetical protein
MFKRPLRCILRVQEAIALRSSWFGRGCPSGGDTSSFLQERCENRCPSLSRGCATRDVKPLITTLFNGQKCVSQQDSAPAHKAKTSQEWLRRYVLAFISAEDWPSGSPDLNPLDYKLWAVLEDMACRKRHNNLDSLKRFLVKVATEIPLETVRAAIAEWPECLKACVEAESGHFQWHCYKYV